MAGKHDKKAIPGPPDSGGMTKRFLLAASLLGAAIVLAYSNSLNGPWALDDVVANRSVGIHDIRDLVGLRKIAYLTFLINQKISPFSPLSFRLFNILIHIVNTMLVSLLAYRTFMLCEMGGEGRIGKKADKRGPADVRNQAFALALFSGAVFGLHPININAVAYIVQRMASLAALFVLFALHCYISAARSNKWMNALFLYASSGVLIILGIFSKENAVMALPLFVLYDYVFLSHLDRRMFVKRSLILLCLGLSGAILVSYLLNLHITFSSLGGSFLRFNEPLAETGWGAVDVYWTPLQQVLTEFRVLMRYLFLVFLPLPRFLVFDWWGFPVSTGIMEPATTGLSVLVLSSALVLSVWKIKRFPFLCFGVLWYVTAISLESFFALGIDLYFEHRNYLPVSGLIIGIFGQIVLSLGGKIDKRTLWSGAAVLGLFLGALTFSRNFVWKDSFTLWGDVLQKRPSNIRALMAIGNAHLMLSDIRNAEIYYKKAMAASAKEKRVHFLNDAAYSLGMVYLFSGRSDEARDLVERMERSLETYRTRILRGFYKTLKGDTDGGLKEYQEIIGLTTSVDTVVVWTLMGDAYREKGLWDTAIEHYGKALSLAPDFAAAHYGLGMAYLGKRDIARADEHITRALSLDPNHVLALSDKADILVLRKGDPDKALEYVRRAVSMSPYFYQPYLTMGSLLVVLGRDGEAEEYYKKALEHNAPGYMVPLSKARAYYMKGDEERARQFLSELRRHQLPENVRKLVK